MSYGIFISDENWKLTDACNAVAVVQSFYLDYQLRHVQFVLDDDNGMEARFGNNLTVVSAINALTHLANVNNCRSRCYTTHCNKRLVEKGAESAIFEKLKMSFGQAVHFKAEFAHLNPPVVSTSTLEATSKPVTCKPTMGQLSSFDPAVRRLYLSK